MFENGSKYFVSISQRQEKKMKVYTIKSWKSNFPGLLVKNETLFWEVCISQNSVIVLEKYYNPTFTNGRFTIEVPSDAHIKIGLDKMMSTEKDIYENCSIQHIILQGKGNLGKGNTDFEDLVNLQVLNGAEFHLSSYVNKEACGDSIQNIADFLFDEEIAKKLRKVNFIGLLFDGSTDKSVVEQEVIYITFMDPDTYLPMMKYFTVVAPTSQDLTGIKEAIENSFEEQRLSEIIEKIVFIGLEGASVNSEKDSGFVKILQANFPYVTFVWCFSLQLEQSLYNAFKAYMDPIHTSLMRLYYLHEKSSKITHELKVLSDQLKKVYEIDGEVDHDVLSVIFKFICNIWKML